MTRTVLDMTQAILSALDSDPVSSISDTYEAQQVADRLKDTYFDFIDEQGLPAAKRFIGLYGRSDINKPNVLWIPDKVSEVLWFKYNVKENNASDVWKELVYKDPKSFVEFCNTRDSLDTDNVYKQQVLPDQTGLHYTYLLIDKTKMPDYWTTFDDEEIYVDSWDNSVESTIQAAKTQAYCEIRPVFTMEDDFIPELPENLFSTYYAQALSRCYVLGKESLNPKFEEQEERNRVRSQRLKFKQSQDRTSPYPDYGRRRRG